MSSWFLRQPHVLYGASYRVLTFSIIAEAHLSLAKANGIFPLTNAIELLEFCLVDALEE